MLLTWWRNIRLFYTKFVLKIQKRSRFEPAPPPPPPPSPLFVATPLKEATMLSAEEYVIMQTALVEAMSTNHLASEVTWVLMNTWSRKTYIIEKAVQKLNQMNESTNLYLWSWQTKRNHVTDGYIDHKVKRWIYYHGESHSLKNHWKSFRRCQSNWTINFQSKINK